MPSGIYPREAVCYCACCIKRRKDNEDSRLRRKAGIYRNITSKELDRRALERPISNTESGRSFQSVRGIGSTLGGQ